MPARGVLVTRPEPRAAETARRLQALGWQAVVAPALVLTSLPMAPHPAVQAALVTSIAALPALAGFPGPVLAVGAATAEAARAAGFSDVQEAGGDAVALVALARARLRPKAGPLLLAVGAGYGAELAQDLRAAGFRVLRRIAYEAMPAAELPPLALAAMRAGQVGSVLFFSPRSARLALALWRQAGFAEAFATLDAFALSPRVAAATQEALGPFRFRTLRIAERPDQNSLLELLGRP